MRLISIVVLIVLVSCSTNSREKVLVEKAKAFVEFELKDREVSIDKITNFTQALLSKEEKIKLIEMYYGANNLSTWFLNSDKNSSDYSINIFNTKASHRATFMVELSQLRFNKGKSVFEQNEIIGSKLLGDNNLLVKIENRDIPSLYASFLFTFDSEGEVSKIYLPKRSSTDEDILVGAHLIIDVQSKKIYYEFP